MTVKITTNKEDKENSQRKNWALIDPIVNLRPCLIKVHCLAIAAMLGDMPMQAVIRYWGNSSTNGWISYQSQCALGVRHVNNPELNLVFGMSSTLGLLGSQDVYGTILCFFWET